MILYVGFLLVLMSSLCDTTPSYVICADEIFKEGLHYFPGTSCSSYKHCYKDGHGLNIGEYMECPFPTYWNQNLLTCTLHDTVNCPLEYCLDKPDDHKRPGKNNCRSYWSCTGGKSVARCCPPGQRFDNVTSACTDILSTDEPQCYVKCLNEEALPPENSTVNITTTTPEPIVCDKQPVTGRPGEYIHIIPGHPEYLRFCSAGTIYNETQCACVKDDLSIVMRCAAELRLTFTTDLKDTSEKHIVLKTENVLHNATTGSAYFNGNTSSMKSQRFNNIEHVEALIINIEYRSDHANLIANHSLMSNDECQPFSIDIKEDKNFVYFSVGTTQNGAFEIFVVSVPQGLEPITKLQYKFMHGVLTGTVNGVSESTNAPGYLINVHCGLTIGHSSVTNPFHGDINDIQIYFCDPESNNTGP